MTFDIYDKAQKIPKTNNKPLVEFFDTVKGIHQIVLYNVKINNVKINKIILLKCENQKCPGQDLKLQPVIKASTRECGSFGECGVTPYLM